MIVLGDFNTSVSKALSEIDPKWRDYTGLVVCGTHSPTNPEILIDEIRQARESGMPALLICYGHQLGAIEYARSRGIKDATSEEWSENGTFIVKKRPEGLKVGLHEGESWWSNYFVDMEYIPNDNFVSVPYHPEYGSAIGIPHPDLVKFLNLCKKYEN